MKKIIITESQLKALLKSNIKKPGKLNEFINNVEPAGFGFGQLPSDSKGQPTDIIKSIYGKIRGAIETQDWGIVENVLAELKSYCEKENFGIDDNPDEQQIDWSMGKQNDPNQLPQPPNELNLNEGKKILKQVYKKYF